MWLVSVLPVIGAKSPWSTYLLASRNDFLMTFIVMKAHNNKIC